MIESWSIFSHTAFPNKRQGRGEEVARSIFPETTIVRPAPLFGFEDNLLLKLAGVTNLFTANNMQERYWPVHVGIPFPTTRCG